MKAIILCAGSGERWGNYMGIPKQLVEIEGERLLFRTIRQLKESGVNQIVATVPSVGFFGDLPVRQIVGSSEFEIDKIINAESEARYGECLLILGDVYFTDEAMKTIISDRRAGIFFGRPGEGKSKKDGEIFALNTTSELFINAREVRELVKKGKYQRSRLWELYWYSHGNRGRKEIVHNDFVKIDDWTDDFDQPAEFEQWLDITKKTKSGII